MVLHDLECHIHSLTAMEGSTLFPVSVKKKVFFRPRESCLAAGSKVPEKGQNTRKSLSLLLACPAVL